ncbi:MAG: hypothetical protein V7767_10135 [Leeuwenhoekiella sp.]
MHINLDTGIIKIEGILNCSNVTETQFKIECALDFLNRLTLNLSDLEEMDVSFMIYLLMERAKEKNKIIILTGCENDIISKAFNLAGLKHILPPYLAV